MMLDLPNDAEIVAMLAHRPGRKLLLASSAGRGFVIDEAEVVAQTKAGKQIMNLDEDEKALGCVPAEGDAVAVLGDNRKLLVFKLDEVPEMSRGRGVILQRYKDGGLADIKVFHLADGLSWNLGERVRTEMDLALWLGERGQAGRLPPNGFPRSNR
jgi:topoisomerase-4 subunit A